MALTASAEGVGARLSIDGVEYCVTKIEDRSRFAYVDPNGELMCNSYDHAEERVALGVRMVRLHVLLEPTPEEWNTLLPLIGYSETTDVFTTIDALTSFNAQVDYDGTDVGNYLVGKVDVAIARGQQGLNPVSLELQMVFQDYDLTAAFSGSSTTVNAPYEFTSGALTLASTSGTAHIYNAFVWVHNNNLKARFNNSVTATNIVMTQRTMHLGVNTPFTSVELNLLTDAISDTARLVGQDASLTFTRTPQSLAFAFTNLKWETKFPNVDRKDAEIRLNQYYKCYTQSGGEIVSITNTLS